MWHDSYSRVTWLILTCDMTLSFVWHDSLLCTTWLHTSEMPNSFVWYFALICVKWCVVWLVDDMTRSITGHFLFWYVTWRILVCGVTLWSYHMPRAMTMTWFALIYVTWLVQLRDMSRSDMRWLRLVGSFKLLVSFAKEPYKRDYVLQKSL